MSDAILNVANPIIEENRTMTREFLTWELLVTRFLPILGSGSPEGVVLATIISLYIDVDSTTPGAIEYRKQLDDIGGDKTQGWVAV